MRCDIRPSIECLWERRKRKGDGDGACGNDVVCDGARGNDVG